MASPIRDQVLQQLKTAIMAGDCFARNHLDCADLAYDQALEAAVYDLQKRRKALDYAATLDPVLAQQMRDRR